MDWANWSMSRKILLPASALLLIFMSFFDWQQTCVTIPTVGSRCAGVSGWHGAAGVILGLLTLALLVWELLGAFAPDVTKNMNLPDGLIGAGLAGLVAIFVLIKFLSANEFRHWPEWVGLLLGIAIAAGAWLRFSESGESLPSRATMMGGGGGGAGAATTPSPPVSGGMGTTTPAPPPPPPAAGGDMGGGGMGGSSGSSEETPPA
ncbi:MAG: hypothetical protein QOG29_786 [Gaiellaceae bacterium]|jgi:hypothetical protein|nr:hypothetical protein [Gaiellaceae bacterium]MDX6483802.1 hypothetical protein [Gaiellaceae bacterium]MDX6508267.1 hypothetical protein [Gaiellaceae bacterium]MDX6518946.1 hypothetical protein [Gaiellaceae bacterium]